jgi:oligopeptide/dipeptide ABC transporter ATP-binding protein
MMGDKLLEIKDLHVTFKTEEGLVKAVNGVSFAVNKGETLGIVGESGCGKSVTSLAAMGLIPKPPGEIEQGRILFQDKDLLKFTEKQMQKVRGNLISMIFQEPMTSLNPIQRVGRQIGEVLLLHRKCSKKDVGNMVVEMLSKVRIPDPERRAREFPYQLSGGMLQRIMIAMALACAPKLLIADEPTTALDVTIQAQILSLINDLKNSFGTAILLITHDLGVVAETADKVAVMYAGRVIESADVKTIFSNPLHPYTRGLMASIPKLDIPVPEDKLLKAIPGIVPSLYDLPKGCAFQDRCDKQFKKCLEHNPNLFDMGSNHLVRCFLHEK